MRRGVLWTAMSRFSVQGLQLVTSVVLARLLVPADFGTAAVVTALAGFATVFADLGLSTAVVQRETVDERVLATVFWLNTILSLTMAAIACLAAPFLADFFEMPQLTGLIYLGSTALVLSLSTVQVGLLRRDFGFRRLGLNAVLRTVVTAAVSIVGAVLGLGPAALVLGLVLATAASTVQLWIFVPWRPHHGPDRESLKQLWAFSRGLLGFMFVNYWTRNVDNLIVGKYLGATALGFYGRAYNLMMLPIGQMSAILSTVLFSALSRVQQDKARFGKAWLLSTKASWMVGTPMSIGIASCAPALVETLFGARWLPMVPVLVLLSAAGPAQIIASNIGPVFEALGKTGLHFRLGLLNSVIAIAAIVSGLPFGIAGIAGFLLASSWLTLWLTLLPALRMAEVPVLVFLRSLLAPAAATAVMAGAVLLVGVLSTPLSAPVTLLLQVLTGAMVFGGIVVLLDRRFIAEVIGSRKRGQRVPG